MSALAVQTENLTKTYKGKRGKEIHALGELNLEINAGTTFGFIGPNGAGKTTTIKILIGLIFPTRGKATVFGHPAALPVSRKNLGYLSEVASYSPHLEAEELLLAFGTLHGMSAVDSAKNAKELLDLVGLLPRQKSKLGEFSKGMLQRFGIAQALLHNPKLLILDEPTSGLDPIAQREILDVLTRLKNQGITIFFSSHRLVEVQGLCDQVGIVSLGNLIFNGTISQLEAKQQNVPYIIRFHLKSQASAPRFGGESPRQIDGTLHEVTVQQRNLNQALHEIQSQGIEITSIVPKRLPLEEVFIRMITEHQKGDTLS